MIRVFPTMISYVITSMNVTLRVASKQLSLLIILWDLSKYLLDLGIRLLSFHLYILCIWIKFLIELLRFLSLFSFGIKLIELESYLCLIWDCLHDQLNHFLTIFACIVFSFIYSNLRICYFLIVNSYVRIFACIVLL